MKKGGAVLPATKPAPHTPTPELEKRTVTDGRGKREALISFLRKNKVRVPVFFTRDSIPRHVFSAFEEKGSYGWHTFSFSEEIPQTDPATAATTVRLTPCAEERGEMVAV